MYLITNKEDNRILNMGEKLDYMDNGYPRLINENVAFPTEMVNVYEVENVDESIEPEKWCYTEEKGFYENENYEETSTIEEKAQAYDILVGEAE